MSIILQAKEVNFKNIITYPNICIPLNKTTFIQGKSGCGKSTLLKMFNATVSASSGTLLYNDTNIDDIDTIKLRQEVLLASQNVFLFSGSIKDNFNMFYEYRSLSTISDEAIEKYLKLCCADFSPNDLCETMSGGERQRIYIAICLSLMPKVLMLDEPTSALDEITSHTLIKNIKDFCVENEITLIVISHNPELCQEFADNIITLSQEDVQ